MDKDEEIQGQINLIMTLRSRGISDAQVLNAIERTPRHKFVSQAFRDYAYRDMALPVEAGQTIPEPYIIARICEALWLKEENRVLVIGTGGGYLTAILSIMARRIYTMEILRDVMLSAEERFEALGLKNIATKVGNGWVGWVEQAPFDRIVLTAAVDDLPVALFEQLKTGGIIVYPQIGEDGEQNLIVVRNHEEKPEIKTICPAYFSALLKQSDQ